LSDVIAPAAAGAILGGVSLGGGSGRPLGIAAGALTLAVLRSGLNAVGAPPFVNDIAMGAVLVDSSRARRSLSGAPADLDAPGVGRMTGIGHTQGLSPTWTVAPPSRGFYK